MRVLVSGRPGVGKTTLLHRLTACTDGCSGFLTLEVRKGRKRVGFDLLLLSTGERIPFARVCSTPVVGRYCVDGEALREAVDSVDPSRFLFVDEIGPMEIRFPFFVKFAEQLRDNYIATVHRHLANEWKRKLGAQLIWLTPDNREMVFEKLCRMMRLHRAEG